MFINVYLNFQKVEEEVTAARPHLKKKLLRSF